MNGMFGTKAQLRIVMITRLRTLTPSQAPILNLAMTIWPIREWGPCLGSDGKDCFGSELQR